SLSARSGPRPARAARGGAPPTPPARGGSSSPPLSRPQSSRASRGLPRDRLPGGQVVVDRFLPWSQALPGQRVESRAREDRVFGARRGPSEFFGSGRRDGGRGSKIPRDLDGETVPGGLAGVGDGERSERAASKEDLDRVGQIPRVVRLSALVVDHLEVLAAAELRRDRIDEVLPSRAEEPGGADHEAGRARSPRRLLAREFRSPVHVDRTGRILF